MSDNKRIVVIDDEQSVREVVQAYLEKDGYHVFVAGTGSDGLALAERMNPALIVLDLMLPDVSGEEVCSEIRSRSDVPILMLTAKASEEDRVAGLVSGADDYLVKPDGAAVELTPNEYKLLVTLARYPGRAYSRFELINRVQGYDYEGYERTIDVHVKNLRKKIEPDPAHPRYVETVMGVGYKLAKP